MRILVLSDIHANRQALEAIREEFDVCLFLGDLVDYCLEPGPCIEWVRKHARYAIRGNHDHGAAQRVYLQGVNGFRYLSGVTRPHSIATLNETDRNTSRACRPRSTSRSTASASSWCTARRAIRSMSLRRRTSSSGKGVSSTSTPITSVSATRTRSLCCKSARRPC
jgi:hypothetical protein